MKKRIVTGLFTALAVMANAQSFTEWQNPEVNAVTRAPMHTNYFAYESEGVAQTGVKEGQAIAPCQGGFRTSP